MDKNFISAIFRCLTASVIILMIGGVTSCMDTDTVEPTPYCAITSFTVGSITSYVPSKKYDSEGVATDTIVSRTVLGSDIYFNIDQLGGHITTVDSLPNWIDLTRVVPTFTNYGTVYRKVEYDGDSIYYPVTSGTDSIDFSQPTELLCVASDGISAKRYYVEMRKASISYDTLEWKGVGKVVAMQRVDKAVPANGACMVFGKDSNGKVVASSSTNGEVWSNPTATDVQNIDAGSVLMFKDKYYALDTEGNILCSENGTAWSVASAQKAKRLLATDEYKMYIYDGECVLGTDDMEVWQNEGDRDMDMLPDECLDYEFYTSRTNNSICVAVLTGLVSGKGSPVAWYKTTSKSSDVNQKWAYIQPVEENPYTMPTLGNMSMTRYYGTLYLIGTQNGSFAAIYRSVDNGITWQKMGGDYTMPDDILESGGRANLITVGDNMWIVQQDGNVWVGSLR